MKTLLLLSGPVASGKTEIAKHLIQHHSFKEFKSSAFLKELAAKENIEPTRFNLQEIGDNLDTQTDYFWIVEQAIRSLEEAPENKLWLIDSVRKKRQIEHFRNAENAKVIHAHVYAPESILETRYKLRQSSHNIAEYENAIQHTNEISARALFSVAELLLDTSTLSPQQASLRIIKLVNGE